jgi:epoxide hydrolase 4
MFRFRSINLGKVELHCAEAGEEGAPLIICLHGFPEYWAAWREVMAVLAADFHILAPDQRGYNLSSRPKDLSAYRARHLVADIAALADELSPGRRFALAGHDWGASVAYAFAFNHPDRLSHLVIANGVHPVSFQRAIIDDPEQRAASQYIRKLVAPGSEAMLAADGYRRLLNMVEGFSAADFITQEMRAAYREAWSQPDALEAMLNWYRASELVVPLVGEEAGPVPILDMAQERFKVHMPHLVLWGEADQALRPSCLLGLDAFAADLTIKRVPGAGHWILHERPDEVASAMRAFITR